MTRFVTGKVTEGHRDIWHVWDSLLDLVWLEGFRSDHAERHALELATHLNTKVYDAKSFTWKAAPPELQLSEDVNQELHDDVNHPAHYTHLPVEVIDIIEALGYGEGFAAGNAVKYMLRAGVKDPNKKVEDFKKARWYLDRLISNMEAK